MLSCALLLFLLVPAASARCVDKYYGAADCVQRCQSKMGYPGMMMGRSAWGTVIDLADASQWTALVSQACGLSGVPSGSKSDIPAQAAGVDPSSSTSASLTTSSSSSSVSVSANSTVSTSTSSTIVSSTSTQVSTPTTLTSSRASSRASTTQSTTPTRTSTIHSSHTQSSSSSAPPKSTSTPSGSPPPSSGGSSSQDPSIQAFLDGHNTIRAAHGAKPLIWSNSLAASAQQWANGCVFKHSQSGENLAAGVGGGYDIAAGIKSWTDEVKSYDPNNPQPSHFTQVVWKATTQVGCAQQLCNGIFDSSLGKALYLVCHYSPPGNVDGQYSQNVQV